MKPNSCLLDCSKWVVVRTEGKLWKGIFSYQWQRQVIDFGQYSDQCTAPVPISKLLVFYQNPFSACHVFIHVAYHDLAGFLVDK